MSREGGGVSREGGGVSREGEGAVEAPGHDHGQRRTVASAAACASNSVRRPSFARSSSSSSDARSNGLPSAVPWSST